MQKESYGSSAVVCRSNALLAIVCDINRLPYHSFVGVEPQIGEVLDIDIVGLVNGYFVTPGRSMFVSRGAIDQPDTPVFLLVQFVAEYQPGLADGDNWIITDLEKWYPMWYSGKEGIVKPIPPGVGNDSYRPLLSVSDRDKIKRMMEESNLKA